MKKKLLIVLSIAITALFTTSCTKDEVSFDENLLIGKWQSGTVFEKYNTGYTGSTWDTSDDVSESEAQAFTWTLEKDQLEQIHIIQNGGNTPKTYVVTVLTTSKLEYKDSYGKVKSFSKVN